MKDTEMLLFNGIIYTKNNVNLLLFISAVHPLMLSVSYFGAVWQTVGRVSDMFDTPETQAKDI